MRPTAICNGPKRIISSSGGLELLQAFILVRNHHLTQMFLILFRRDDDHGKPAVLYKSEKRSEMENEGFRIIGNSGDQWSDLLGTSISIRSFKLPNPMYYIS